jgi:hypothetical protein
MIGEIKHIRAMSTQPQTKSEDLLSQAYLLMLDIKNYAAVKDFPRPVVVQKFWQDKNVYVLRFITNIGEVTINSFRHESLEKVIIRVHKIGGQIIWSFTLDDFLKYESEYNHKERCTEVNGGLHLFKSICDQSGFEPHFVGSHCQRADHKDRLSVGKFNNRYCCDECRMIIITEQNRIEAAEAKTVEEALVSQIKKLYGNNAARKDVEAEWMKVITILKTHRAVFQSEPKVWTTASGETCSEFTVTYSDIHKIKSPPNASQAPVMCSTSTSRYHEGLPLMAQIKYKENMYCYPCAAKIDV